MIHKKLLIFNGSPRKKGTSFSFGRTLKILIEEAGHTAEILHVIDFFDEKISLEGLKYNIEKSDMIALVAPLYVDTLPYPVMWFLEKLAADFQTDLRGKNFFAIGQCGFPDITRNEPLIESCRLFAEETGMKWLGGLSYGGGAILNGKLVENLGKEGRKITAAFKLALEDALQGKQISSKSQELITVKIPRILLRPLAAFLNHQSRKLGKENGIKDLTKKVYLE
ncbi:NAD(P)H-dependent oxidoreductase [Vallitalea okinawensis]|uniref:NAD(P)H-dependent oxidoreductase n=1 Tax=Vallitalea okinawensis TaxID=2078660 RepID=UPI000CFDC995|nr:NAD(P)H-dependent oxidoreductase [Vallitalea okinawensis]